MVAVSRYTVCGLLGALTLLGGCDRNQALAPDVSDASPARSAGSAKGPSNLAVTASPGELDLSWLDNAPNETGFEVLRSTSGANGVFTTIATTGANVTRYSDTGLDPAKQYCYKVQAVAQKRIIGVSDTACATPLRLEPNAASNLDAVLNGISTVLVTWTDNSFNEDGFKVARAPSKDGPFVTIVTLDAGRTAFADGSPIPNHEEVCYEVVAFNKDGGAEPSNIECTAFPFVPTELQAVTVDGHTIDLSWLDNSSFEDGYEVSRCCGQLWSIVATLPAGTTGYRDVGLAESESYTYLVRAKKDQGYSAFSATASASTLVTPPPAPTSVQAWPESSDSVFVTWAGSFGSADGFRVERSTDHGMSWTVATVFDPGGFLWLAIDDDGRAPEQEVCYRVVAFNALGESGPSPIACTVPPLGPSGLFVTTVDPQTVDLTWTDNSGVEDGYVIAVLYDGGYFHYFQPIAHLPANSTTFRLTDLSRDAYYVAATRDGGYSDYAGVAIITSSAASAPRVAGKRPAHVILTPRPHH